MGLVEGFAIGMGGRVSADSKVKAPADSAPFCMPVSAVAMVCLVARFIWSGWGRCLFGAVVLGWGGKLPILESSPTLVSPIPFPALFTL